MLHRQANNQLQKLHTATSPLCTSTPRTRRTCYFHDYRRMIIESYAELVAQAEQLPDETTPLHLPSHRADLQVGRRLSIQSPCSGSGSGSLRRRKRQKNKRVTYCLNGNVFANSKLRVKFGARVPGVNLDKRRNIRNINFDLARPLSDDDDDDDDYADDDDDNDADAVGHIDSRMQGQCVEKRRNMRNLNFDQSRQLSDEVDDESELSLEKQEEEVEQLIALPGPVCNATYALIKPNNNNNYIMHNPNDLQSLDLDLTMELEISSRETTNATRTSSFRQPKMMQETKTLSTALAATNESQRSVSSSTQSSTVYLLGHHLQISHRLPEIRITTMQRPDAPTPDPHRQLFSSLNRLFLVIIGLLVLMLAIILYRPV